jgi:two-component system, NtrC family, sensor kinase
MTAAGSQNRRVLVIDDNLSIHDDFRRILAPARVTLDLDAEAAALFGDPVAPAPIAAPTLDFILSFASQGEEGRNLAAAARSAGQPFAFAFVDMRMPPGWDGLTTIRKIWEVDPALHVVICTAHADRSWEEIASTLPERDRWAVLKKPFDKIEVVQFAHVMTAKWNAHAACRTSAANI